MIPDLLQRHAPIPVVQIEDGMEVEKTRLMSSRRIETWASSRGCAAVDEKSNRVRPRGPGNYFFRHLADDKKEEAISVILSGKGSDGALGSKAIKGQMGMVMIQDPTQEKLS